jgi:predicted RNase H-like HicB family nuclease
MAKEALGLYLDGEHAEELPLPQTIPELSNPNDKAYLIEASIHYYGHGSVQDAGK